MLARGERLGPYEILVSIGASGMGDRAHIPINAVPLLYPDKSPAMT
jgi:hypothetical protein